MLKPAFVQTQHDDWARYLADLNAELDGAAAIDRPASLKPRERPVHRLPHFPPLPIPPPPPFGSGASDVPIASTRRIVAASVCPNPHCARGTPSQRYTASSASAKTSSKSARTRFIAAAGDDPAFM